MTVAGTTGAAYGEPSREFRRGSFAQRIEYLAPTGDHQKVRASCDGSPAAQGQALGENMPHLLGNNAIGIAVPYIGRGVDPVHFKAPRGCQCVQIRPDSGGALAECLGEVVPEHGGHGGVRQHGPVRLGHMGRQPSPVQRGKPSKHG